MKKSNTIPVVEKRNTSHDTSCAEEHCCCHSNNAPCNHDTCGCQGGNCGCHGNGLFKTTLMAASIWGASFVVAAAILATHPTAKTVSPVTRPVTATVPAAKQDTASIKKFIESNPQLILDTVNKHLEQQRRDAEEEEAAAEPQMAPAEIVNEIIADKSNYSLGNPNGKFVIIEFFDHQCGWCKRTNAAMYEALEKAENNNIRWIPIDTPIFGAKSQEIARFVLAAGKQGKYAEMHHAVGQAQGLDNDALIKIAQDLKLDTNKLKADAESDEIKAKLEANQKYARQLNINGVPMLIVNGKINPGALFGERLEAALKEAREMK